MNILDELKKNIVSDYYTANFKSEVTFDTLLTPVIADILTVIGRKYPEKGINGEKVIRLTKEFPMLKKAITKKNQNYSNWNADYLMCDDDKDGTVYLVELKTTMDSLNYLQMYHYIKYIDRHHGQPFAQMAGKEFIALLNHVSCTGYVEKEWKNKETKDDLKKLFEKIIHFPEDGRKTWDVNHASDAENFLRKKSASSSEKYLLIAGQMLDSLKQYDWWDKKNIKLIYLIPEMISKESIKEEIQKAIRKKIEKELKKDGKYEKGMEIDVDGIDVDGIIDRTLILVTFQDIYDHCQELGNSELKEYWGWVKKILKQCNLFPPPSASP